MSYRATVIGPGATPDVVGGALLGAYDHARDLALGEAQRTFFADDGACKPV